MPRDNELEQFKGKINLVEFAQSLGYQVDRRESSQNSKVMRHDNGDKIVVATSQNGHGIYFSVRDDRDNGSIIDFVQKRTGAASLGQIRKTLRPWIGGPGVLPPRSRQPEPKPPPSSSDRQRILLACAQTEPVQHHAYLASRGIADATLADPRFVGMVRQDTRGNAVFPHHDNEGVAGYEMKNRGFTGFAAGGTKALWHSTNLEKAKQIVIVESAIDALSHAQLHPNPEMAYVSIGGQLSEHQRDLLHRMFERAVNREAEVIIATDNDLSGKKLAGELQKLLPAQARFSRAVPARKDWNDDLQYKQYVRQEIALSPILS
jgi:5S rRNA maturation endonuclease (ribonuclease M5)